MKTIIISIKQHLIELYNRYHSYYFGDFGNRYDFDQDVNTPQKVNDIITTMLSSEKPCMIARFGNSELTCMLYYMRGKHPLSILRKNKPFWVPKFVKEWMVINAGFFPNNELLFCEFSDYMFKVAKHIDLLGSWISREKVIDKYFEYKRCPLHYLLPFFAENPWTKILKGKKVLVIHPFSQTIKSQYEKRNLLFENPDMLPTFKSLIVLKSVQSIGGESNGFHDWFEALAYMEKQIDAIDYDVALIGCGAYGMPLAAHCKQKGKQAIHLGGALQLMFGIKGKRWEEDGHGSDFQLDYKKMLNNPYWARPSENEKPIAASKVENSCYW